MNLKLVLCLLLISTSLNWSCESANYAPTESSPGATPFKEAPMIPKTAPTMDNQPVQIIKMPGMTFKIATKPQTIAQPINEMIRLKADLTDALLALKRGLNNTHPSQYRNPSEPNIELKADFMDLLLALHQTQMSL